MLISKENYIVVHHKFLVYLLFIFIVHLSLLIKRLIKIKNLTWLLIGLESVSLSAGGVGNLPVASFKSTELKKFNQTFD